MQKQNNSLEKNLNIFSAVNMIKKSNASYKKIYQIERNIRTNAAKIRSASN